MEQITTKQDGSGFSDGKTRENRKKFLMIGPKTKAVVNFRGDLIKDIIKRGYDVVVIAPEDDCRDFFKENGVKLRLTSLKKNSLSVFNTINYYHELRQIIKEENPDKVFSFTLKPVIFGSVAAKKQGVREIYSLISGLGLLFSSNSPKIRALRFIGCRMYRYALKFNTKVIFQNKEDINEFVRHKYVKREQCALVNGSGVNLEKFARNELPKEDVTFIMVSRILKEKGVLDYFKAAKIVKAKRSDARFVYIGAIDKNQNAIKEKALKPYIDAKVVDYISETNNVERFLSEASVVVLPSYYREGIPRTLLEAMAMGRPILTTSTPGCRETVVEGENGYFVKVKRAKDLAEKMEYMIEHKSELQKMGNKSYEMCLERFTIDKVNGEMMQAMEI